jgi:hypothetical protein
MLVRSPSWESSDAATISMQPVSICINFVMFIKDTSIVKSYLWLYYLGTPRGASLIISSKVKEVMLVGTFSLVSLLHIKGE